jgi:hypothetical protein
MKVKKKLSIKFTDSGKAAHIELDDSQSPKTVKAILDNLPIEVKINRWGDELYTDKTPIVAWIIQIDLYLNQTVSLQK